MPGRPPSPSTSPSNRQHMDQPRRDSERNRTAAVQTESAPDPVCFPEIDDGMTLLDIEGGCGVAALQSLVLDHLLMHDGPAFWVDAHGDATTTTMASLAPSQRLLERIHVARGFTAYQHYGAVCHLQTAVTETLRQSATQETPSLIIAPAVDAQYRADDTLCGANAEKLQARTLARLRAYADAYDVPALLTRSKNDAFTEPVATVADHHVKCRQTRLGPRFVGSDFETLVYPVGDGAFYQTTFAYWRQILDTRARQTGRQPTQSPTPTSTTPSAAGVGRGVTVDGEPASLSTDPLLDVWNAANVGGR